MVLPYTYTSVGTCSSIEYSVGGTGSLVRAGPRTGVGGSSRNCGGVGVWRCEGVKCVKCVNVQAVRILEMWV